MRSYSPSADYFDLISFNQLYIPSNKSTSGTIDKTKLNSLNVKLRFQLETWKRAFSGPLPTKMKMRKMDFL